MNAKLKKLYLAIIFLIFGVETYYLITSEPAVTGKIIAGNLLLILALIIVSGTRREK